MCQISGISDPFYLPQRFPEGFSSFRVHDQVPRAQQSKFSKKTKRTPQRIRPSYKCAKFQKVLAVQGFPRVHRNILVHLGSKIGFPGPQNQNFQKMKTPTGIHSSYRCATFQTDLTINTFPRVPQKFLVHLGSRTGSLGPRHQNFQKMRKKTTPGIHSSCKCGTFQTDLTIYACPRASQYLQDTHTHNCQVLAQLKLRTCPIISE